MSIGIYCICNILNNKKYIGKSVNISRRFREHINKLSNNNHSNQYLQYAWNKYGKNNFEFIVIEECNINCLNNKEIYWIKNMKTLSSEHGYNIESGGTPGCIKDESKEKVSNSLIGRKFTLEHRRKIGEANSKRIQKNETKLKISLSHRGSNNINVVITEDEALLIIKLLLDGYTNKEIHNKTNISYDIIRSIKRKDAWTYLTKDISFPQQRSNFLSQEIISLITQDILLGLKRIEILKKYNISSSTHYRIKQKIA